jgi:hypothetical protein
VNTFEHVDAERARATFICVQGFHRGTQRICGEGRARHSRPTPVRETEIAVLRSDDLHIGNYYLHRKLSFAQDLTEATSLRTLPSIHSVPKP